MTCYHPLKAFKTTEKTVRGRNSIVFTQPNGFSVPIELPCGKCIGCRIDRSQQWATRLMQEAQFHEYKIFITLTYDDEHLPKGGTLVKRDYQLFMKRLRKRFSDVKIRFFACGEYGDQTDRPHYHAILYGIDFADKKIFERGKDGINHTYTSETLRNLWGLGHVHIGSLTWTSAAYVARYVIKKVGGPMADEHYRRTDLTTGEQYQLQPEYINMSTKPGIGAKFYEKYQSDIYPSDFLIVQGKRKKVPAYYDRKLDAENPEFLEQIKSRRSAKARTPTARANSTPARLQARETCQKAKLKSLKRKL